MTEHLMTAGAPATGAEPASDLPPALAEIVEE